MLGHKVQEVSACVWDFTTFNLTASLTQQKHINGKREILDNRACEARPEV